MDVRAAEISAILKDQISNFGSEAEVSEVGRVLSVGDGIARVYGLDQVQAGARGIVWRYLYRAQGHSRLRCQRRCQRPGRRPSRT